MKSSGEIWQLSMQQAKYPIQDQQQENQSNLPIIRAEVVQLDHVSYLPVTDNLQTKMRPIKYHKPSSSRPASLGIFGYREAMRHRTAPSFRPNWKPITPKYFKEQIQKVEP
jgi:hypothetical protein